MLVYDSMARYITVAVAVLAALWCLWVAGRGMPGERSRDAVALALFSASGGMLMAISNDLITLYMALELSTMPAYVLMGYRRDDARGLEGALKYFLLSLLTSLIMLYGLSFVYGLTGQTSFESISLAGTGSLGLIAALLVLVGLFAKMSAAPFHYWTPDAYAGASAAAVAFVSTAPKVAGTAALVRLVHVLSDGQPSLAIVLAIAAAVSMALGNLAAITQKDMRRLMAYSGVAHSGYVLMGVTAAATYAGSVEAGLGYSATIFYAVAYSIPSMAVMLVVAEEGNLVDSMNGLASRRPWVAWSMVAWLLSLIGIPPLVGFFGKFYLFGAALDAEYVWLVLLAVIVSVVSAAYYFRVIKAAFLTEDTEERPQLAPSSSAAIALLLAVVLTFGMGIWASPLFASLGLS
jgi:NADH-quinone oxidoreductase subunit N